MAAFTGRNSLESEKRHDGDVFAVVFKLLRAWETDDPPFSGDVGDIVISKSHLMPANRQAFVPVFKLEDPSSRSFIPGAFLYKFSDVDGGHYLAMRKRSSLGNNIEMDWLDSCVKGRFVISHHDESAFKSMLSQAGLRELPLTEEDRRALGLWKTGIGLSSHRKWHEAIATFKKIPACSKISFNLGVLYSKMLQFPLAIHYFSITLSSDPYFAAAFLARGACFLECEDYLQALMDFSTCLSLFHDNSYIDYNPLGMPNYSLPIGEVYYNRALALLGLGQKSEALGDLKSAASTGLGGKHKVIGELLSSVESSTLRPRPKPRIRPHPIPKPSIPNLETVQHEVLEKEALRQRKKQQDLTSLRRMRLSRDETDAELDRVKQSPVGQLELSVDSNLWKLSQSDVPDRIQSNAKRKA